MVVTSWIVTCFTQYQHLSCCSESITITLFMLWFVHGRGAIIRENIPEATTWQNLLICQTHVIGCQRLWHAAFPGFVYSISCGMHCYLPLVVQGQHKYWFFFQVPLRSMHPKFDNRPWFEPITSRSWTVPEMVTLTTEPSHVQCIGSGNIYFESSLHFSWWPFTLITTLAGARAKMKVSSHHEKCWAAQNPYCPPLSRFCYV